MVTVIIPWRPAPSRAASFDAVIEWYRDTLGDVPILTVDSDDDAFNLARCRNIGVGMVRDADEVVIISDADTIPQAEPLRQAVEAARHSGLVHLPYTEYHWLGAPGTAQFRSGAELLDCDFELVRGACSGVYVTTPATWRRHGGQDERFRGWGFEDAAWYIAHETLLGQAPQRHAGQVFALHHEAELREGPQYDANADLMQRYRDASVGIDDMRQLVFGSEIDSNAENARVLPGV